MTGSPRPNTFLIGAPKCGTTALATYLAEHPSVYFSRPKEPLFWADDLGIEPQELGTRSLAKYQALFAAADPRRHRVIAEGTTSYLRSRSAVANILAYQPKARFIAVLRNPVDVAHAFHMEQRYSGLEREPDFARAWSAQEERERDWDTSTDDRPDSLLYRRIAAFADQIQRLFATVPASQRLVLIYDDLRDDPRAVYLDILRFLDLPDDGRTDFEPRNSAHAQRFPRLAHFLLAPPAALAPPIKALRMALLRRDSRVVAALKRVLNVKRRRTELDDGLRTEIAAYYRPDVDRLERLLGRDLAAWKEVVKEGSRSKRA